MHVSIISYRHFTDYLASVISSEEVTITPVSNWSKISLREKINLIRKSDVLHFVDAPLALLNVLGPKLFRTAIVLHYIGTDVVKARRSPSNRLFSAWNRYMSDRVLTVAPWLQTELNAINISADVLPLPVRFLNTDETLPDLPQKFRVLIYLPEEREEFYGGHSIRKVLEQFHDIRFTVLMHSGRGLPSRSNIEYTPRTDNMRELYYKHAVLLRFPRHDGLSNMVIEALSYGRHVIYNYPLPHCHIAETVADVMSHLSKLQRECGLNRKGAQYARRNYAEDILASKYVTLYQSLN